MTSTTECLTDWIRRQRWFGGKGRVPQLRRIGSWDLESDEPGVLVRTLLVMDDGGASPLLYQVPVTIRETIPRGWGHHLIGRSDEGYLFDGPHDPVYARALVRLLAGGRSTTGESASATGYDMGMPELGDDWTATARVLSGEQSNTSIVLEITSGGATTPAICKIFRTVHHGENPDVVLQSAISAAGSPYVPASRAAVVGEWNDIGRPNGRASGHLAFAQEFLSGVEDAWRVALAAAREGVDFGERARALGEATARVHGTLADAMATRQPSVGDVVGMVTVWRQRLAIALAEVPQIAPHREAIERVYDAAADSAWPRLQRIHGDYHLGQVLSVPGRGWVLLDFEGEPLRPMHERDQLDSPLRDVAGMLRSFDYAAGSIELEGGGERAREWAAVARREFVAGYVAASGGDLAEHRALLDAFEIDKAVYEAVYEVRNRPDWLPIPVRAIESLAARAAA